MGDNVLNTPQSENKRKGSVLSPPEAGASVTKKNKMASTDKPKWADDFATKDYIDDLFNRFKKDIFEPMKQELITRMEKIEGDVSTMDSTLKDIPVRISSVEEEFNKSLKFQSDSINTINTEVSDLKKENKRLECRMNQLYEMVASDRMDKNEIKSKVVDLEDRSGRDNLVIEGLSDVQQCEIKAKKFFKETLKVDNADNIVIGRCHRVGRYSDDKCRQTIVKFDRYKQRESVFEKGKKLDPKGSHKVNENFSKETEKTISRLYPIMRAARSKGYFSKLEGSKLVVKDTKGTTGLNGTCTMDTLDKLPPDLNPAELFTVCKDNVTCYYTLKTIL